MQGIKLASSASSRLALAFSPRTPRHPTRPARPTAVLSPAVSPTPSSSSMPEAQIWKGISKHSSGVAVVSAVGCHNGFTKEHNQDSWLVEDVYPAPALAATTIGVFDGHGSQGHFASRLVAKHMADAVHSCAREAVVSPLESLWWDPDYEPICSTNLVYPSAMAGRAPPADFTLDSARACLEHTFNLTAESVAEKPDPFFTKSGSTAVVCMVLPDSVVVAWAGDSRAVVGSAEGNSYIATQLTRDHTPNKLSEMARILQAGGRVTRPATDARGFPTGPFRVSLSTGRPGTALAVARAFGDLQLAKAGVVPTPDTAIYSRAPGVAPPAPACPSEVLLVASDGLWEVLDNCEAVELAAEAGSPEAAAQRLVAIARHRWALRFASRHRDDITVAVAYL